MKKIYNVMMLAAVAAAALVSCAKEMDKPEAEQKGEGIQITVVTALQETKTYMVDDNTAGWSAGDKVDFVQSAAGEKVQSEAAVISEGKATFTATVANTGSFYAYYPTSSRALVNNHGEVKVLENQYPSAADTFDPAADVLVSDYFDVTTAGSTSTDPTELRFKRLGAFIKLNFVDGTTGSKLASEHASSVAIQSDGTGKIQLVGKMEISPEGIESFTRYNYKVTANYDDGVFDIDDNYAFFGVLPNTLVNGSKLIFTAETEKYLIFKTVTLTKDITYDSGDVLPITVNIGDANIEQKLKLNKLVGIYGKAGVAGWPAYVPGGSMADVLDDNIQLRNATFDKDYIYVAQSESWVANGDVQPYIFKFNVSDGKSAGHVTPAYDPAYMGGSYCGIHPVSCVRFMDNDKPSVNGGKPVLVAVNLAEGGTHRIYAWENGIDNQPRLVANFSNDRRLGDKVSVEGNYWTGKLWFRSFDEDAMVCYVNFVDGYTGGQGGSHLWNWVEARGKMPVSDHSNISEYYTFGTGNYGLIATNSAVGLHLMDGTTEVKLYEKYARSFGWHAFTFNGKNYLAFLDASDGLNKPRITVLKGDTDSAAHLQETIDNQIIVARVSIASSDPYDFSASTTYAHQNLGDCQVRVLDDGVYILGMIRGGVALFKVALPD